MRSINVRENSPSTFNALRAKLLAIPYPSELRGDAQVDGLEEKHGSNGFVQKLSSRCSDNCESKVYQTLARIVRRDDATKQSSLRQGVLLKTCKIGVATILGY